ncbi:Pyruvate decarboxylase 2 [Branchiostoma belcheri]|nr:Pyruvate decarboxylase 2 [Branchiostoma belcheri]
MYNSETWTLTATHELRVNAFDTRCLRRLLGIRWFDRVPNATLHDITKQPPLTSKIRLARLRLFGHIARAVPLLEPAALLREPAPTAWSRPRGHPRRTWCDQLKDDLLAVSLNLDTTWEAAQDRTTWRSICRGATLPSAACGLDAAAFTQIFGMHAFIRQDQGYKQVIIGLMSEKDYTEEVCSGQIKDVLPRDSRVDNFVMDFGDEMLGRRVVRVVFPTCNRTGCAFHLTQDIYRKILQIGKSDIKKAMDRISAMFFCNMTGTDRLTPQVIGHSRNPSGMDDGHIFKEWVRIIDVEMGMRRKKIVLLLDNCMAHPHDIPLDNIRLVFLPANTTSLI